MNKTEEMERTDLEFLFPCEKLRKGQNIERKKKFCWYNWIIKKRRKDLFRLVEAVYRNRP